MDPSEKIGILEEKARTLEEKVDQLRRLLESITSEFEDLQKTMNRSISEQEWLPISPYQPDLLDTRCLPVNKRIGMDGDGVEDRALDGGWYPSDGKFRWAGKDRKHPLVYFKVSPNKSYRLKVDIFVPRALIKKPIKILANNVEVDRLTTEIEGQIKKTIHIPSDIVTSDKLRICFQSGFWNPSKIDPTINDNRTLSLAFNYLELMN